MLDRCVEKTETFLYQKLLRASKGIKTNFRSGHFKVNGVRNCCPSTVRFTKELHSLWKKPPMNEFFGDLRWLNLEIFKSPSEMIPQHAGHYMGSLDTYRRNERNPRVEKNA